MSDTKEELLEHAAQLFEENGYKGTSIRDIARATDTSISNIYHYFGNKEGLWKEIQNAFVTQLPDKLRAALRREDGPLDRFKHLLRAHLEALYEYRRESRIFFLNSDQLDPGRNKANRELQRQILDIYLHELAGLKKAGHVRSHDLTVTAFNIFGVINWSLRWYRPDGPLPPQKVNNEIIGFILRGVGIDG
jgi:TetR/AcrR family transcriptional regulator, cholesterol catabolism regulator